MYIGISFLIGLLFGLGLVISKMVNPAKVLGFLDIFGRWDPSLALVLGSAVGVSAIGFYMARRRSRPLLAPEFRIPTRRDIDLRLLAARPSSAWAGVSSAFAQGRRSPRYLMVCGRWRPSSSPWLLGCFSMPPSKGCYAFRCRPAARYVSPE